LATGAADGGSQTIQYAAFTCLERGLRQSVKVGIRQKLCEHWSLFHE